VTRQARLPETLAAAVYPDSIDPAPTDRYPAAALQRPGDRSAVGLNGRPENRMNLLSEIVDRGIVIPLAWKGSST
jgi:hypothetical protein